MSFLYLIDFGSFNPGFHCDHTAAFGIFGPGCAPAEQKFDAIG